LTWTEDVGCTSTADVSVGLGFTAWWAI